MVAIINPIYIKEQSSNNQAPTVVDKPLFIKTSFTDRGAIQDRKWKLENKNNNKLFWSISTYKWSKKCWVTIALIREDGTEQNIYANYANGTYIEGNYDLTNFKEVKIYKDATINDMSVVITIIAYSDNNIDKEI